MGLINSNQAKRGFKNRAQRCFFFATPDAKVLKQDLSSASKELFRGFLADFLVAELPQKRGRFNTVTKNHSLLVNWYRLSVDSRALTCPFKQSNPSIWSLLSSLYGSCLVLINCMVRARIHGHGTYQN